MTKALLIFQHEVNGIEVRLHKCWMQNSLVALLVLCVQMLQRINSSKSSKLTSDIKIIVLLYTIKPNEIKTS